MEGDLVSPRQRARRRERRRIIRIDRMDVYVRKHVVTSFALPTFHGARYDARARRYWTPSPPMVTWFNERWNAIPLNTPKE